MWRLQMRRWNYRRRGKVLAPLLEFWAADLPDTSQHWSDISYLVCDAEMSGLEPENAELLSLGWVVVNEGEVDLATAEHRLIRNVRSVGQSAAVHQLRDCELSNGELLDAVLKDFLKAAEGRVLVFHYAPIDLAFLNRACRQCFGAPLYAPVADTLALEQQQIVRANRVPAKGELRLQVCRDRYGLLPHRAHNALADAIATAELFLAQCAHRDDGLQLGTILRA